MNSKDILPFKLRDETEVEAEFVEEKKMKLREKVQFFIGITFSTIAILSSILSSCINIKK